MSSVTIKEVARAAGVGIATVSRVARGNRSVSADLRRRVEEAMARLGYAPDSAAQTMRTRASRTIACAIRDISIPEFASFVHAAEQVIRTAGYTLILANTDEDPRQEVEIIKTFGRRRIDGLLMTRSADDLPDLDRALARLAVPVVFIDRDVDASRRGPSRPPPRADAVVLDHRRGMAAAVDHLVSLGHTRIALITGKPHMRPARERLAGYREGLTAHGIPFDERLVRAESFEPENAFWEASFILRGPERPTALIAGGMSLLVGVLKAVAASGLRIPDDISVVSGCESDLAMLTTPPITAIRWDVPAWGRASAQLLIDRICGRHEGPGREILLPTELVIRGSSAMPCPGP